MANSPEGNGWKECYTLIGQAKFCFGIENEKIPIRRRFKNAVRDEQKEITFDELDKVQSYVQENPGTGLGNSVNPLSSEGIGWYLREKLGWKKTVDFQLASQIAALFVRAEAWKKVDKSRKTKSGMQFELNHKKIDWKSCISDFYNNSPDCTMTN